MCPDFTGLVSLQEKQPRTQHARCCEDMEVARSEASRCLRPAEPGWVPEALQGHGPPRHLRPLTSVLFICASACVTLWVSIRVASGSLVHYMYTCVCVCVCGSVCTHT